MMEKMGIDERDGMILSWYMENPNISQNMIAKRLKLSQPSVNFRIQKLIKRGLLTFHAGMDFNNSKLFLMRVDFTAKSPSSILDKLKKCSFFVNGFIMSGKNNVSVFLVCEDLRKIDEIINSYIRTDSGVSDINTNIIVSTAKDFVFRINLEQEIHEKNCRELGTCEKCNILRPKPDVKLKILE